MKNTILLLISSLVVFYLTSCGYEKECESVIVHNLKDIEKYIPYKGYDTLRFLHNNLDTQTYIGKGLERYYVRCCKNADGDCFDDHESVRIRFKNIKNIDEIKMEYVYNPNGFNYLYRIYYKNYFLGERYRLTNSQVSMTINSVYYDKLDIVSNQIDTAIYALVRYPLIDNQYSGIIKIKYLGDILTLLR